MNYIKSYVLFESPLYKETNLLSNDEIEDIKNICLDLEDEGFIIGFDTTPNIIGKGDYFITINKGDNFSLIANENDCKFYYSEVEEVINRLENYLSDRRKSIHVMSNPKKETMYKWVDINDFKREIDSVNAFRRSHTSLEGVKYDIKIKAVSIKFK